MQKAKIFPKIIYYVFTFLLGIFLVFTMPYFLMYDIVPVKVVEHLRAGEYREAILPLANVFNAELALERHGENGSVVVYETITYGVDEEGKEDKTKIYALYAGFLYDADGFNVAKAEDDQYQLLVDGAKSVRLYDRGFVYFELEGSLQSISQLTFVNDDGSTYLNIDNANLNFDGAFFTDIAPLIEQYNADFSSTNTLNQLKQEFFNKSPSYTEGSDLEAKKLADKKAAVIIVVYFVCVYIVADFILGNHYIIRFFRWFIYDVCKAKPRSKKPKADEIFGHDYYCQVTVSLDLEAVTDFN